MANPTLEQKRAANAWAAASHTASKTGYASEYRNLAKGLPALIMTSGLMATMAFMESKAAHHKLLAQQLRDWLAERLGTPKEFTDFMDSLFEAEPRHYRLVTEEAMAWLRWLRQMADAVPSGGKAEES